MDCIIIEDAKGARGHLESQLALTGHDINIIERIDSIDDAIIWLKEHTPDLIFLDIQLADGISFEIFDNVQVNAPIIFTTSYNQYAIKAFEVNAIAYLLKPIKLKELVAALEKYKQIYSGTTSINEKLLPLHEGYQERFLVQSGTRIIPLTTENIACFRVHNSRSLLVTAFDKRQFLIDNKFEQLEVRLDPKKFFRINRQYIINIESVEEIIADDYGKLRLELKPPAKEDIIVGRERAAAFKSWLTR